MDSKCEKPCSNKPGIPCEDFGKKDFRLANAGKSFLKEHLYRSLLK